MIIITIFICIYIYMFKRYSYATSIFSNISSHLQENMQNMSTSLATVMIAHTETGVSLIWEDYDLSTMIFQQTILPLRVDSV